MTGKVAVITGGSQGIGAGLVAGYRGQGWAVVASARTIKPSQDPDVLTVDGGHHRARHRRPDHRRSAATGSAASTPWSTTRACSSPSRSPTTPPTTTRLVVGVNLTGFFWLTQRAIAEMLERGTAATWSTSRPPSPSTPNSASPSALAALTKGGLAAATRSLAVEYASRGIRVNAVSPGIIQTPVHPPESYDGPR